MNRLLVLFALLGIVVVVVLIAASGAPSSASSAANGVAPRRTAGVYEIVNIVHARPANDKPFAQATEGLVVGEGGQVQTRAASRVRLDFSEGTTVRLGADSLVTVQALTGTGNDAFSRFFLESGKVWISLFGGSFTIETPVGVATVRGSFAVFEYDRTNDVLTVDCIEGTCTAANESVDERMGNLEGVVLRRAGRQVTRTALNANAVQDFVRNSPEGRPVIATLTAAPPPVEVVSPNGGETLYGDTTIKIGWAADTAVAGTGVRHELWNGRGRVLNLNYAWDWRGIGLSEVYLPLVPEASDYRIRTVSLWDGGLEDSSDGPITVFGGAVRVHAPNGGETWRVGTRQFIHWQIGVETAGSGVHLELWDGSGRVATLASASDPDGENVTQIVVPQLPSRSDYRIRAVAAWGQGDYDESNSTFAIRGAGEGEGSSAGRDSWSWYE